MRKTLPTNEFFFSFPETILFFLREIFQVLPLQKQLKNCSATQAVARNRKTVRNNNLSENMQFLQSPSFYANVLSCYE